MYCEKCKSSKQCWDLNPQLLDRKSSPITTRQGLPPSFCTSLWTLLKYFLKCHPMSYHLPYPGYGPIGDFHTFHKLRILTRCVSLRKILTRCVSLPGLRPNRGLPHLPEVAYPKPNFRRISDLIMWWKSSLCVRCKSSGIRVKNSFKTNGINDQS